GDFVQDLVTEQHDLQQEVDSDDVSQGVRAQRYRALARQVILQPPIAFAVLTLRGLLVNVFDSDWDAIMIVSRLESRTIQIALDAFVAVLPALAVLGVIVLWKRDRALALLIAGTTGYFLFISAGGESEARFRVPV